MTTPRRGPSVLEYGDRALLVELGDTGRVLAWTAGLFRAGLEGLGDVVPAAETLLVVAAEGASVDALRQAVAAFPEPPPLPEEETDVVEIPVRYDGPDLSDVARHTGLSEEEVVEAHTGIPWTVAFGGFAPGFGYLAGGDERLRVPRRDSARTAVPAGAVALADRFSGVYPRESPGGWQLIGTTDLPMWDLDRDPPALLRPGVAVRFVTETGVP
jgi:KipI family sensor histidine kinase inhibitor